MRVALRILGVVALSLTASAAAARDAPLGVHGIKMWAKDPGRSVAFYTALGMREGPMHGTVEWELNWDAPAQGPVIYLLHDKSGRIKMPPPGGSYIMIQVRDVTEAMARLKAAGFTDLGEPSLTPRAVILMTKDPDGNWVQILSPPK
jgi:catechol 2,3-dioxygenase-like lactoylglutathione lyase family enzyme